MTVYGNQPATIDDAAAAIRNGTGSSVALTTAALAKIRELNGALGAFLTCFESSALKAASAADDAVRAGAPGGPLHGTTLAVKDLISTVEGPTTAQSLVHEETALFGDAAAVARLRAAGMIVVGKTSTMEFGVGRHDPFKPYPHARNPWRPDRWTGGSSTGSGAAVASGMALGALGTDTGGSVRIPAALCGVTGLKPTFGLVPRHGCVPLSHSLDHIGPMARTVRDCALMLEAVAGHDQRDPASAQYDPPRYSRFLNGDLTGLVIGVDRLDHYPSPADPALADIFAAAVAVLAEQGAEIVEIELPCYAELTEIYNVTMSGEALALHAPDLETRWADYYASTRQTLAAGVFYSAADYVQAQRVRAAGQKALEHLFSRVDLVATPTTSVAAPLLTELDEYYSDDGLRALNTQYWNATGNPALTVPMGFTDDDLPLGLQIAGRAFADGVVLRAGDAYQRATGWHTRRSDACVEATGEPRDTAAPDWPANDRRYPGDGRSASSGGSAEVLTTVRTLLRMNHLIPAASEVDELAALFTDARTRVRSLYDLPEARWKHPAQVFRPSSSRPGMTKPAHGS